MGSKMSGLQSPRLQLGSILEKKSKGLWTVQCPVYFEVAGYFAGVSTKEKKQ